MLLSARGIITEKTTTIVTSEVSAVSVFLIIVSIIFKNVAFTVALRYFCSTAEGLWQPVPTSCRSPTRVKVSKILKGVS
jgi:hypothetical protein